MSMDALHQLELERIMQPVPRDAHVVPVSFPVTSFGDPRGARLATLGTNPGIFEFTKLYRSYSILSHGYKRLVDRELLGLGPWEVPSLEQAKQILQGNHRYFHTNPYMTSFAHLEDLGLRLLGLSYKDGTLVHIDLVQWATDPPWQFISEKQPKAKLLAEGLEYVLQLVKLSSFECIIIPSQDVFNALKRQKAISVVDVASAESSPGRVNFYTGDLAGTPFISWGISAPNNVLAQEQTAKISARVREFVSGLSDQQRSTS